VCEGGRLLVDFVAGGTDRPAVPAEVTAHLTTTVDGSWVVWAHKLARRSSRDRFVPLASGTAPYPTDAVAACRALSRRGGHKAPEPSCRCGFHALSSPELPGLPHGWDFVALTVVLSGRVLAFDWAGGGVLWRAERQTVIRVESCADINHVLDYTMRGPGDPDGRTAAVPTRQPYGSGPFRLALPVQRPPAIACRDDAGWCAADVPASGHRPLLVNV
jgi:hypothetical protein